MHKNRLLIIWLVGVSFTSITLTQAMASNSSPKPVIPNTKVCRLVVDDAHISTFDKEVTGRDYVKVKTWSECYLTQSKVTILLKIYKVDLIHGDKLVGTFNNYNGLQSGKLVELKDAKILCVNKNSTKYYGVAKAHVVIPGMGVFDKGARSAISNTLKCGT